MESNPLATIPTPAPEAERKGRSTWSNEPESEYVLHQKCHNDPEHLKKWRCEECLVLVCCYWHECHLPFSERSLQRLISDYDKLQKKIDANDGRLTTGSSAQLDYEMELQEEVANEIARRLRLFTAFATRDAQIVCLQEQAKEASDFLNWLPVRIIRMFPRYIHIAPSRLWFDQIKRGLIQPLVRGERPRAIRADGFLPYLFENNRASRSVRGARRAEALEPFEVGGAGRPIPGKKYNAAGGRWGGGILGLVEVGSRNPDDPIGLRVQDAIMLLREWVRQ